MMKIWILIIIIEYDITGYCYDIRPFFFFYKCILLLDRTHIFFVTLFVDMKLTEIDTETI